MNISEVEAEGYWIFITTAGELFTAVIGAFEPSHPPVSAPSGTWIKTVPAKDAMHICRTAIFSETTWKRHYNTAVKRYDLLYSQLEEVKHEAQTYRTALHKISSQRVSAAPHSLVQSYRDLMDIANEALKEEMDGHA